MRASSRRRRPDPPARTRQWNRRKLDTEAHPNAEARFRIQSIPTLIVFRDGKEVERVSGALPLDELRRFAAAATDRGSVSTA